MTVPGSGYQHAGVNRDEEDCLESGGSGAAGGHSSPAVGRITGDMSPREAEQSLKGLI